MYPARPSFPNLWKAMAHTQIILKEKIHNLGAEGDVVKVRAGFARNFLLPHGKAFEATQTNLKNLEELKARRAEREAKELEEAEKTATKLRRAKIKLTLATGQGGKAFGSITAMDIQKAIAESSAKVELDRHQIQLDKPIKATGIFEVPIKVHPDVECVMKIHVNAADAAEGEKEGAEESAE
jgi:large subunit ribosomal protein L9